MTRDRDERLRRLSAERRELLERRLRERSAGTSPTPPPFRVPEGAPPTCSFAQERFWVLEKLEPGNPAHHIAGVLRFTGALDEAALRRSVDTLMQRHETLRTTFVLRDGRPVPTIADRGSVSLEVERQPRFDASVRSALLEDHVRDPFDLERGPLLRARLVQWEDELWELFLCVHHVAADGLSMQLLAGELERVYRGEELPSLPATYAQYAAWQRAWLTDAVLAPGIAWWRAHLGDLPTLELPSDAPPSDDWRTRGARVGLLLRSETVHGLRALARSERTTPFVVTLSAWNVVLARLCGTEDVVVGTPWANRDIDEVAGVVGFFVNSLVLRTELEGAPSFREVVARTRRTVLLAQGRAHVPFERLVDALNPDRDLRRHPLYQVMFNWVDFGAFSASLPGGVRVSHEATPAGTLVDASLYAHVDADAMRLELEYDAARFTAAEAERWLGQVEASLTAGVKAPDTRKEDLPLPAADLALLRRWGAGATFTESPKRPLDAIREHARATPDAPAVTANESLTYAQLMARVDARASAFRSEGIGPGHRVVVSSGRTVDLVIEPLAAWAAGAAWVPVDPAYPAERRRLIEEDVGSSDVTLEPDTGYVIHTSGSTGAPKGVVVSQHAVSNLLASMAVEPGFTSADVLVAVTTLSFDIAVLELMLPLCTGGRVVVASEDEVRDGKRLARLIEDSGATVMQATPATWRMLLHAGWEGSTELRAWCGGEPLARDLADALIGRTCEVWNLYGPTETCIWSTAAKVGAGPVTIGRPIHGTRLHVVDVHGRLAPLGATGELWIAGAGVADGYLSAPGLTEERFVPEPGVEDATLCYRTGDIVRWRNDGSLTCLGRLDDQLKVRGFRVEPGEVEAALRELPGVADAAVAARPDASGGARLCAWVVPAGTEDEGDVTRRWRAVWDDAYTTGGASDAEFDIRGWTSVVDGQPIPEPVMRVWLRRVVSNVRSFHAGRVLEVGCGTGLVTARCAGETQRWLAFDPSPAAVDSVRAIASSHAWDHVAVVRADASGLRSTVGSERFDLVLVNSVVQYLPDAGAFAALVSDALDVLEPGGTLFLGDLRNLTQLEAMYAWAGIAGREEVELCVDPAILFVLRTDPRVSSARLIERGDGDDELTRFRFDVVVTRGRGASHTVLDLRPHTNEPGAAARDRLLISALRGALAGRLPDHLVPDVFVTVDALPLTPNGKVDRNALPAPERSPVSSGGREPATDVERTLVGLWTELLGRAPGLDDDWFELGGHSLLAAQLLARVRETLNVDPPLRALFEAPTVGGLAAWIEGGDVPETEPIPHGIETEVSFGQERLWFLDRLQPGDSAYHMAAAYRLVGELDRRALEQALHDVAERHPSLRTTLPECDGRPCLRVDDRIEVQLSAETIAADAVPGLVTATTALPFDLATGPLWRVRLLQVDAEDHVLVLVLHHAIADAWSVGVLARDLAHAYTARRAGRVPDLQALSTSPGEWAAWQRDGMTRLRADDELSWWRETLDGAPSALELPWDRPRPPVQSRKGAQRRWSVDGPLWSRVVTTGQRLGATPFEVLSAALGVLLWRLSGSPEVVVGTSVAQRERPETREMVGFLVNALALRVDVDNNPSFAELVSRVATTVRAATAHQEVPFERLVDELGVVRDLSRAPLFQVSLDLVELPSPPAMSGLTVEDLDPLPETAKLDLGLRFETRGDSTSCVVEWSSDLLLADTVESWWTWMVRLLDAAVENPDARIASLPLMSDGEREQVDTWLRGAAPARPAGATLDALVRSAAASTPDAPAIVAADGALTFAELVSDADRVACGLASRGVGHGDRVGLYADRTPGVLVALLGVLRSGAAYVPLDPEQPDARLRWLAEDAGCVRIVAEDIDAAAARGLSLDRLVAIDALLAARGPLPEGPRPHSPAYVLYTSGSTGDPKGVVVSHRAIVHYVSWAAGEYVSRSVGGIQREGGAPVHTSLGFDLTATSFLVPWMVGRPAVIVEDLASALRRGGFDFVKVTPSHLATVRPGEVSQNVAHTLVVGGEPLAGATVAPWIEAGVRVVNEYGPTEATVGCVFHDVTDAVGSAPIGRPIAGTHLRVVDAFDVDVPPGCPGELVVAGPCVASGYHDRPTLTAERFVHGGEAYRTGDVVRLDLDGVLHFVGRRDDQVKVRGVRVEPGAVEHALRALDGVRDAAVIAHDAVGGLRLVAYVVSSREAADLRRALADVLPAAEIPSLFVPIDVLPLTRHKKIDRAALPEPTRAHVTADDAAPPRDSREAVFARLAADVLGMDEVGVGDGFFELGGDSIRALDLVSRARGEGLYVHVRDVFEHPTPAELAAVATTAPQLDAEQGPVVGPTPLLPVQSWWCSLDLPDPGRWHQGITLTLEEGAEREAIGRALAVVVAHHDLLRATLASGGDRLVVGPPAPPDAEFPIADATDESPRVDLQHGPLLHASWATTNGGPRLHLVAHHLVCDAVSWRVIVEDLVRAYAAVMAGTSPDLPPKTSSFAAFATRLSETAQAFEAERSFWVQETAPAGSLPCTSEDVEGSSRSVVAIDRNASDAILGPANRAWGTRPSELVLAAVVRALARETDDGVVVVDVEGHGREDLGPDLDVSRTVGWFTSIQPVRIRATDDTSALVRGVKERLRTAPRAGVGYGVLRWITGDHAVDDAAREVLFNWLGSVDTAPDGSGLVRSIDVDYGLRGSNPPTHPLTIDAEVRDGRIVLVIGWRAPAMDAVAARLASEVGSVLGDLANALEALPPGGITPSDVPVADIDQEGLLALVAARGPVEDVFPLTPTQQGMVLHALYDPGSNAYVEQLVTVFSGDLDADLLRRTYESIVAAYPLFRAGVSWRRFERPHWVIRAAVDLPWEEVSLEGPEETTSERLDALAVADRTRGLDLECGPLVRCTFARLGPDRVALLLTWHHAVLDGWSLPLLLRTVSERYDALRRSDDPRSVHLASVRDYVAWLDDQDTEAAREHFRRQLRGFAEPTLCDLRAGEDRPGDGEQELVVDADAWASLRDGARSLGVTTGTLVQAAWGVVLARASGRDDVVFGVTVSGRTPELPGIAERIGCFVNTLPVRVRVDGASHRGPWLRDLQRVFAESAAFEHAPLPLTQAEADVPPGTALFDSLVVVENYPVHEALEALRSGPLLLEDARGFERTSYGITLVAVPGEQLTLRLIWGAGHADATGARYTLERLVSVLHGLVGEPHASLGALAAGPCADERARLDAIECGAAARPWAGSVNSQVLETAAAHGERLAVDADGETLSYRALAARVAGVQRHLLEAGARKGEVVAVTLPRGADWVVALLGVMGTGAAWMPVDPALPAARREVMSAEARASRIVGTLDGVEPALGASPVAVEPDDVAYVLFTSGTSGVPKGVAVPHRAIASYARSAAHRFGLGPQDRVLHFASLGFDTGLEEVLATLVAGATVVPRTDEMLAGGPAFLREVDRLGITVLDLPTAFWHELVLGWREGDRLPACVRLVILGGEAARADLLAQWHRVAEAGVELLNTYGPTETTIVAAWCSLEHVDADPVPIGKPVPGAVLRVVDDSGRRCPVGTPGELWIGGEAVALGYVNDPDLTARSFVEDEAGRRFFRTGDRVRWGPDGALVFLGRSDRQVKVRGQRVEPGEVERTLERHGSVVEAAVDARAGPTGPVLRAWVVVRSEVSEAELLVWLTARMPAAMIPSTLSVVEALPRGATGKLDLVALPDPATDLCDGDDAEASPEEAAILEAFESTFRVEGLGRHANFFDLGGDSLTAVRLMTRLETAGLRPTLRQVLEGATPARIAVAMAEPETGLPGEDEHSWLSDLAVLDEAITPPGPAAPPGRPLWCVMLTGATGFLGGYMVRELLERTNAEVVVLVRGRDERDAQRRIREHLERHGMWSVRAEARLRVVVGDLARPRFGLDDATWDALAEEVDEIWHAGAVADFVKPYEQLEAANVGGTLEVLRLATTTKTKAVHHVSTIGVFDVPDLNARAPVREDADLLSFAGVQGGYAQTKWVAERLVQEASARGVPVTIHRPGRLVGDSETGLVNEDDLAARLIAACLETACVPQIDGMTDATPVDFAARAIVALSLRAEALGRTFHIVNPRAVRLADLGTWLRERRPHVRVATLDGWMQALGAASRPSEAVALAPLLAVGAGEAAPSDPPPVTSSATTALLESLDIRCPEVGAAFVARVLDQLDPRDS